MRHVLSITNDGPGLVTNFSVNIKVPLVLRDDITVFAKDFEVRVSITKLIFNYIYKSERFKYALVY